MKIRNISHFEGLDEITGRGKASLFTLLDAENIRIHTGEAELRKGQTWISDEDHRLEGEIKGVYEYSRYGQIGSELFIYREYVISVTLDDGNINYYGWNGDTDNTIDRINETGAGTRIDLTSDDIWAAEYMDWMFICNGVDKMYKYDAINFYQVGMAAPLAAPTVTITATPGNPIGYRKYKYRYVRVHRDDSGNITDYAASPFSEEATSPWAYNFQINVNLVQSTDEQVTNIELYATELFRDLDDLDGATFYRLDTDLADLDYALNNASQNYQDNLLDILDPDNIIYHPAEDTTEDWTSPPDGMMYLVYYKDRLYGVCKDNPSYPRYSGIGEPESWPSDNWVDARVDDGDIVTGYAAHGTSLYIFKNRSIWSMTGDPEASPVLQPLYGGERVGTQTEFGLGCTAPRSIATYGEDLIIFYSSTYGVYMISGGELTRLSQGVNILGLSDDVAGAVWANDQGEVFYTLSQATGVAYTCHIRSRHWVKDTNVNPACFCVDHNGYLIGGDGGYINRYYDPDADTDNGETYYGKMRNAWLNLRNADLDAVVRKVQVQSREIYDPCTMTIYNQDSKEFTTTFTSDNRRIGVNGMSGRLFSTLFTWSKGVIESLTFHYIWRRGH